MEANHVTGVLEPSRVTFHLPTSHFLGNPLSLSLSAENILDKGMPMGRVPGEGRTTVYV